MESRIRLAYYSMEEEPLSNWTRILSDLSNLHSKFNVYPSSLLDWEKVLVIIGNEIHVSSLEEFEKLYNKLDNGETLIWIGSPFKIIYSNLDTVKMLRKEVLEGNYFFSSLGISRVYIGYDKQKGYFLEIEKKFESETGSTCEDTKFSDLLGIIPEKGDGIPLGSNVVPYNICQANDKGKFTTSYSIIIGKGHIIRPFITFSSRNILILLSLIYKNLSHSSEEAINYEINTTLTLNNFIFTYSQAVSLYLMGYYTSSAVVIRRILEDLITEKYRDILCSIASKKGWNDVSNSELCEGKGLRVLYNFVDILEKIEEKMKFYGKLANYSSVFNAFRVIGNKGAHDEVDYRTMLTVLSVFPSFINDLNNYLERLSNSIDEGSNSNRSTNKGI
ncbi:hypothetical protein SJAV_08660 [Sulfurisphaera javensis]|uniref:DUF4145 domain-containing protein n=1 Tax=Sulfurisphaera javensis TaxID=2049879 RepID=A0AAT9GQ55_9CREN